MKFFAFFVISVMSIVASRAETISAKIAFSDTPSDSSSVSPKQKKISSERALISELSSLAPGESVCIALHLKHPKDWHSYYSNSGGIELAPQITWDLPEGFQAGPLLFPKPNITKVESGTSFTYHDEVVLLTHITAPSQFPLGEPIQLKAKAVWQICKDSCIQESEKFIITLRSGEKSIPDPKFEAFFQHAKAGIPSEIPANSWKATAFEKGKDQISLQLDHPQADRFQHFEFIPDQKYLTSFSADKSASDSLPTLSFPLKRQYKDFFGSEIPQGQSLSGILTIDEKSWKLPSIPIQSREIVKKVESQLPTFTFANILKGMFLGGLLLNLMPCVFPVIGLKIMGFVEQAGSDRKKVIQHGFAFTAGVFISFAVLTGILFSLRSTLSWGFQLQNPWVIFALMLLMFIMALNLSGVFEIGTSATSIGGSMQNKDGLFGSMLSGMLATVVATPCSAPFLGSAIGLAVTLPTLPFFTAFAAMALGLSTPYLILSIFPNLLKNLPRPGAWMETFKQAMAFLLYGTAGFLLWVYAGLIDLSGFLPVILGITGIAAAAWVYGRWFRPHLSPKVRYMAVTLAAIISMTSIFYAKPPIKSSQQQAQNHMSWEPWTLAREKELVAAGQPVFIDFTASWCLTCKLNKSRAYTPEVIALMRQKKIVALVADKTQANPEIEARLRELNRSAIPVNVYLAPEKSPVITPEILSPDFLKQLFSTP